MIFMQTFQGETSNFKLNLKSVLI